MTPWKSPNGLVNFPDAPITAQGRTSLLSDAKRRILAASILGSGAVFLESTVATVALPAALGGVVSWLTVRSEKIGTLAT